MFELCGVRPFDIHQRRVDLYNPLGSKVIHLPQLVNYSNGSGINTYTGQISLYAQPFEVSAAKDKRAKVLIDGLVKRSGRGERRSHPLRRILVSSIPIDSSLDKISGFSRCHLRQRRTYAI